MELWKHQKHIGKRIYATRQNHEVSWTQAVPKTSLEFLHSFNLTKNSPIIDIGGGESTLVDFLLDEGFTDVTVLDISENALDRAKARLGNKASHVQWIVADIRDFTPARQYHVWHDRATFHFLTAEKEIANYISLAANHIDHQGFITIGTFSKDGPTKCSGLAIQQYSEESIHNVLRTYFEKIRCLTEDHETPFHTLQNFLFCSFRKVA